MDFNGLAHQVVSLRKAHGAIAYRHCGGVPEPLIATRLVVVVMKDVIPGLTNLAALCSTFRLGDNRH